MEYGYSSTIIASVEMSALLFFPIDFGASWMWQLSFQQASWILKPFYRKTGYMACSQCGQGVVSLTGCNGVSGIFKIMRTWIQQVHSGSFLHIHENRAPLSVHICSSCCSCMVTFPVLGSILKLPVTEVFTDASGKKVFLITKYFFFVSVIWFMNIHRRKALWILT